MTETLLWQTLEDCFRKGDLTGIAALADEVALGDEQLAATLRWVVRNQKDLGIGYSDYHRKWLGSPFSAFGGTGTFWSNNTLKGLLLQFHQSRLSQLEFFQ